jgi:hypothetical protein
MAKGLMEVTDMFGNRSAGVDKELRDIHEIDAADRWTRITR